MRISNIQIKGFRGISKANLFFENHTVFLGDNNTGKSTVLEAMDLVLGPERLYRTPVVNEHDFYNGSYQKADDDTQPEIRIEVTIIGLNDEQKNRFNDQLEWWDKKAKKICTELKEVEKDNVEEALRITFTGNYDADDDDFKGGTYFTRSLEDGAQPAPFSKRDKQICGFLYLRGIRTGTRALSLEKGSLLDIILRLKELRPNMWEKIITPLSKFPVAADDEAGIIPILQALEESMRKFVPREWGVSPHLKVSNLTREHLRRTITAFIATGDGDHAAPFYRQGAGTLNLLVLTMLSMIAEEKQNVIFAMEEPETAIPPYTQKRIIHEIQQLAAQSFFTSHSPYVIEEFTTEGTCMLSRDNAGLLAQIPIDLPEGIKNKKYKLDFRTKFCEGLLARRVLICEGATETSSFPALNRKLSEEKPSDYSPLEALGICTIDAQTESQILPLTKLYRSLGKEVFVICDLQEEANKKLIEAEATKLFMHGEKGFENLVLKNTNQAALLRFAKGLDWPAHLKSKYAKPEDDVDNALFEYLTWAKGTGGCADLLLQCAEVELPTWIKDSCKEIKSLCETAKEVATKTVEAKTIVAAEAL